MNKPILECNGIAAGYVKDLDILQGVDPVSYTHLTLTTNREV